MVITNTNKREIGLANLLVLILSRVKYEKEFIKIFDDGTS